MAASNLSFAIITPRISFLLRLIQAKKVHLSLCGVVGGGRGVEDIVRKKKNSGSYKKIDESHNLLFVFVGEVLFFGSSWALLMAPRTASIVNYDDNYCWVLINTFASGLVPRQTGD